MNNEMKSGPETTSGMGWRVGVSIASFFGSMIAVIIWLFFYAASFTVYQNIALVVVVLLAFMGLMGATWASWGMKQRDYWHTTAHP
jgi:VIT1/CCC1 family predicted Fe2+/Mn2+ transporter